MGKLTSQVLANSNEEDLDDEDLKEEEEQELGYGCSSCHKEFEAPSPRCPNCKAWNTIQELGDPEEDQDAEEGGADDDDDLDGGYPAYPIDQVPIDSVERIATGITELDRVLGGGLVPGGVFLVGGDPGVGKSTLLLQALAVLSADDVRTLYVTAEESSSQVAQRARRLEATPENLHVLEESDVRRILRKLEQVQPLVLVIDSVQTMRAIEGQLGTVNQVRAVTDQIRDVSRTHNIATFIIGHVTKDGGLAGPKVLEHLVDTVLAFEGERGNSFRTLRAHKNRFGSATEVGIFEMTAMGMREVPNASEFFLAERREGAPGSIICATSEGNRSMLVEVQALTSEILPAGGRVICNGIDSSRLSMILAVLGRDLKPYNAQLNGRDVFVNVAGGVNITEPALDLAIALALASSLLKTPLDPMLLAFGEIGLTGEIRGVARTAPRLAEAASMGFATAIMPLSKSSKEDLIASGPKHVKGKKSRQSLEIAAVRSLSEALGLLFRPETKRSLMGKRDKNGR